MSFLWLGLFSSKNEWKLKFRTLLKKEIAHLYNPLCARKLLPKAGFSSWLKFFCKTVHILSRATVCTAVCVLYPREIAWFVLLSSIPRAPSSLSPLSTAVAGTFLEKKRSVKIARILRFFSFRYSPFFFFFFSKNSTNDYSLSKRLIKFLRTSTFIETLIIKHP